MAATGAVTARITPSPGSSTVGSSSAKSRAATRVPSMVEAAQAVVEADLDAAVLEGRQRRIDEGFGESLGGDQRPAGVSALGQRLANHRSRQGGGGGLRVGVERRHQKRMPQPVP